MFWMRSKRKIQCPRVRDLSVPRVQTTPSLLWATFLKSPGGWGRGVPTSSWRVTAGGGFLPSGVGPRLPHPLAAVGHDNRYVSRESTGSDSPNGIEMVTAGPAPWARGRFQSRGGNQT